MFGTISGDIINIITFLRFVRQSMRQVLGVQFACEIILNKYLDLFYVLSNKILFKFLVDIMLKLVA